MSNRRDRTFQPSELKDGRTLRSLGEARQLFQSLLGVRQGNPTWGYLADLLDKAEDRNEKYSTMDARAQFNSRANSGPPVMKVDADKSLMDVFCEGLFARALGYPTSRNPYISGSLNHEFWRQGWGWVDYDDVELPPREVE